MLFLICCWPRIDTWQSVYRGLTLTWRTGVSVRGAGRSAREPADGQPRVEDEEHQEGAQWHPLWVSGESYDDDISYDIDDDIKEKIISKF